MQIRQARPEDAKQIQELMQKVWLHTYPNNEFGITKAAIKKLVSDWSNDSEVRSFAEKIQSKKITTSHLVAEVNGKIVANMVATANKLRQLYIDPVYQHQGIGTQMLARVSVTKLEVATYNLQAIKFYKKHGFEIDGETIKDFGEVKLPVYIMKKNINHAI